MANEASSVLGVMEQSEREVECMKKILTGIAASIMIAGCFSAKPANDPSHTVAYVDLNRYMGAWYEIASFPAWFQKDCFCSKAEYVMMADHVAVKNSCRRGSKTRKLDVAAAKARVEPNTGNARLKVQFFWPFKGDYWIIALDEENYQYAMVGHPSKKYLWVLSRAPVLDEDIYRDLVEKAKSRGYDVSRLNRTSQDCS